MRIFSNTEILTFIKKNTLIPVPEQIGVQGSQNIAPLLVFSYGFWVIKDPGIRERFFGVMEGLIREEILAKFPDVHAGYMKRREHYHVPEDESLMQFYQGVKNGLHRIVDTYKGKKILLVTHGGVLDCVMGMIFDIPLGMSRKFSIYNSSINNFSVK